MNLKSFFWSLLAVFVISVPMSGCSDDDDPVVQPTPEPENPTPSEEQVTPLTFTLEVTDVTESSAAFSVVVSNNEDSYYTNILPAHVFENRTDSELMNMFASEIKADALRRGDVQFTYDQFKDNTDYIFFAFGFAEGKFTTDAITKLAFKTLESKKPVFPEDGPDIYLKARYEASDRMFYADMKCLSKDATSASFTVEVADALEQVFEQVSVEYFMDPANGFAVDFTPHLLDIFNGEGFDHEGFVGWDPQLDGVYVAALLMAKNDKGTTIKRSDAMMGPHLNK